MFTILPPDKTKYDEISLGEVMLRFDPMDTRIKTARMMRISEGGGEYNVARGLRRAFGLRTAMVTGNVDNEVGYLLEDLMLQGGVDLSYVKWFPYDGIGRDVRVGLNFVERGFGIRAAKGVSDRAYSAAGSLKKGDIPWKKIFLEEKSRWFHTGGIFAGLSESTPEVVLEAMAAAKEAGTIISYDLNYRPSLWKARGGIKEAQKINREIARYVDVMIGNEEDFSKALGYEVEDMDDDISKINVESFRKMIENVVKDYPNFHAIATTLRNAKTATFNDWGGMLFYENNFYEARMRENLEIYDRVGGGDSFASGLIYGFLSGKSPQETVEYGVAHGALAMTTPGDTTMASLSEIEKAIHSKSARVDR